MGSGKEGGGQSLARGKCVCLGSAGRATGSEPGGDTETRTSLWWDKLRKWPLQPP